MLAIKILSNYEFFKKMFILFPCAFSWKDRERPDPFLSQVAVILLCAASFRVYMYLAIITKSLKLNYSLPI